MYETTITYREAGQRFDKYLLKLLPEAGSGFVHKMLRKKNITLNEKKADGSERLMMGDKVAVYFSDETLARFMGTEYVAPDEAQTASYGARCLLKPTVIYENAHILIADKPSGLLTQKSAAGDYSLNDWLIKYMLETGQVKEEELRGFKPSSCNRLDRNTSGIVLCAKTVAGAQMLGEGLRSRTIHKYYLLYAKGKIYDEMTLEGYLKKDEKTNRVRIFPEKGPDGGVYISARYVPLKMDADKTLIEAGLITGRAHQLRAQLAGCGHPILGDYKYGDKAWNDKYKSKFNIKSQLLHAHRVVFGELKEPFSDLSGKEFTAPPPAAFKRIEQAGAPPGNFAVT